MVEYGKRVIEHRTHGSRGSSLVVKNKDTPVVPAPPPLEEESPWPPDVILPVKYKVDTTDNYPPLTVTVNFPGAMARVDFGDGSMVGDYTDNVEHVYEDADSVYTVTVTPLSRIDCLSTDIMELVDWGSSGSVKRFRFLHMSPIVPAFIPEWIKDTSYMFDMCQGFRQDISEWNVTNVTNMEGMFRECRSQISDLSSWDVSNVTNMSHLFEQSSGSFPSTLSKWNVSNVTDMSYMFSYGNAHQVGLDIGAWDVGRVVNMSYMFDRAHSFNVDLSSWDVSNVTDMSYMFNECHALFDESTPIGYWSLENWNVSQVTNMECMFKGCFVGVPSNISRWKTGNVTNMKETFAGCQRMGHLTFWDTSSVTTMEGMFQEAYQFNSDLSNWNVSKVTNMDRMFSGVQWFISSLENWNVQHITVEPPGFLDAAGYMPEANKPIWGQPPSKA